MMSAVHDLSLQRRNLLEMRDFSGAEISAILQIAEQLKAVSRGDQLELLRGKTLALLFEKPSLRTRVSFETAMTQLGGHAIVAQGDFMGGMRESVEDIAGVMSRYVDAIMVRTHLHEPLRRFAATATVPVINGLSQAAHPCQALADVLTIRQRFGTLSGIRVAYIGDARNNVAASLAEAAVSLGAVLHFGCPPTHRPSETFLRELRQLGRASRGDARAFSSPQRAVRDADIVYTDLWTSMGEEAFRERNTAALLPYRVDARLMSLAPPHALFMHCMPPHRGEEVTAEVIDGPRSIVLDQAENRLHTQKALLLALLTDLRGLDIA
jgi:ornithine carbamoyltransferase